MSADAIEAALDRSAIDALQRAYADAVTRRDWPALTELFLPEATVSLDLVDRPGRELVGPAALGEFVGGAIDRFSFFQFVILNSHVDLWPGGDHDAATARIFMCELRVTAGQVPATRSEAYGLYCDAYARVDGRWWIAGRRYRSMARFPDGVVFPLPDDV